MVSKTKDDFPLPLTPVKTTSLFRGISKLKFLRLCSRAPFTIIFFSLLSLAMLLSEISGK